MASQVVESQVFPIQLEWIGGRSTFIQSSFSPRNAYICLEDMKEQHIAVPVVIEKMKNLVVFRQDNRMMDKVFEIKDIVQIHCFPTDPNYAIFEINEHDGSARFEVIRAPENESLKVLQDFIFTPHFVNPSAPVLPEQNAESSSPVSDGYETPKPIQTVTNDGTSPNFQVTDGYEGMEVQIIDETINERVTPASRSKDSPGVGETKAEISVKEVDRSRETPSTTSVSSDTLIKSRQPEDFTVELIHESPLRNEKLTQQEPEQQQRPLKTVTIKQRKFAKLVTLKELITEEGINTQNYFDDGKFYVISRKGPKGSFPKSFGLQSSEYSKNQPQNRYVSPSLHIYMETPDESCLTDMDASDFFVLSREEKHLDHRHKVGIYYFKRNPSTLQYNSSNLPPYDESYYSFVYMKKKHRGSSSSESLNY